MSYFGSCDYKSNIYKKKIIRCILQKTQVACLDKFIERTKGQDLEMKTLS